MSAAAADAAEGAGSGQAAAEQEGVSSHGQADGGVQGLRLVQGHLHLHCWLQPPDEEVHTRSLIHLRQLQHQACVLRGVLGNAARLRQLVEPAARQLVGVVRAKTLEERLPHLLPAAEESCLAS